MGRFEDPLSLMILRAVDERQGASSDTIVGSLGGYDQQIYDHLKVMLDNGLLAASKVLTGDGTLQHAQGLQCSDKGRELLAAQSTLLAASMPANPDEAWQALLAVVEPFSPLEGRIQKTKGDLEQRGVARSGPAIVQAMRLATAAGFRWDPRRRQFRRPLLARLKTKLIALAGGLATATPLVFRDSTTTVTEAVGAAATTAAVFVALYAVTRS